MSTTINSQAIATRVFLTELQTLPVINDAFTIVADLYNKTQDYKYVGMAVDVASVGLQTAASMLPVSVLAHTLGTWKAVDKWACQSLDTVKTWAPSITKPTTEMVGDARETVLKVVAGCQIESQTLAAALTARVEKTVSKLSEYESGRKVVAAADDLLDKANVFIEDYLPSVDGESSDSDGDGGIVVKVSSLAAKTRRRVYRAAHDFVHTPDCVTDSSTNSSATCEGNYTKKWICLAIKVKPEAVKRIIGILGLQTTRHLPLQTLVKDTATLHSASYHEFATAVLSYSQGVVQNTVALLRLFFLLSKVVFKRRGEKCLTLGYGPQCVSRIKWLHIIKHLRKGFIN